MVFATYVIKVDTLNTLNVNASVLSSLYNSIPDDDPPVISAVMFRSRLGRRA